MPVLKAALQVVRGRVFRLGFVAVAVVLGGYAVVAQWAQVSRSIGLIGLPAVVLALGSVLFGLLTALVMLPFTGASSYLWAFAVMPVLLASLHPAVLNRLMSRLLRLLRQPPLERPLSARAVAVALGWSFVMWICGGAQIWLLMTRLGAPLGHSLPLAMGGYAFAWSVGFIVVFAPAGAGLREVLLVTMLSPVLGMGGATAVALMSRVLTTAGDLLTAAATWFRGTRLACKDTWAFALSP